MTDQTSTARPLSGHERVTKGLKALVYLVLGFFTMLYGLILSTNFITQMNPLNTGMMYLVMILSYGLVALLVLLLLHIAIKSFNQAFSGSGN
jgi:cytochrome c biogenesis protein CcdA